MKNLKKRNLFTLPDWLLWLLNQIIKKIKENRFIFRINQNALLIQNDVISQEIMEI